MTRSELLDELWLQQDTAFDITTEYDSIPHKYGTKIMFQAEAYMLDAIGENPGITITELSDFFSKTVSACSQLVKKLVDKGLAYQRKNKQNNRMNNIFLTDEGTDVFKDHISITQACKKDTFDLLKEFTDKELETAIEIQKLLNTAYGNDLKAAKQDIDNFTKR